MKTKEGMSILGWASSGSVQVSHHFSPVLFIARALQRHDRMNSWEPRGREAGREVELGSTRAHGRLGAVGSAVARGSEEKQDGDVLHCWTCGGDTSLSLGVRGRASLGRS